MNESVGFLFIVETSTVIENPQLRIHNQLEPTGIEPIRVELARVHPVHIDRYPGWHIRSIAPQKRVRDPLDVLVPLDAPQGGMPKRLDPKTEYVFWVELMPPKTITPGVHRIAVILESQSRPKAHGTLEVELTVWPMVLPDESDISAFADLDHVGLFRHHLSVASADSVRGAYWRGQPDARPYDDLLRSTLQLLQQHRISPVLSGLSPGVKVLPRGEVLVDWSGYDEVIAPLMDGSVFDNRVAPRQCLVPLEPMALGFAGANFAAPGSKELVKRYIEICGQHFREKGWIDRALALVESSRQDPTEPKAEPIDLIDLLRSADPEMPVALLDFPQDMTSYGWFGFPAGRRPADVWITSAQFYDPDEMERQRARGARSWLFPDRPPFSGTASIHSRPADTLVLSWQAAILNADNLWLGGINHWPTQRGATPAQCAAFDPNALLFPGQSFGLSRPVPTLRLKRIRETMQYVAYMQMLSQHGRSAIPQALAQSLVPYCGTQAYRTHFSDGRAIGWPCTSQTYEQARLIMADQMITVAEKNLRPVEKNGLAWRQFEQSTGGLGTRIDGTRVRITGTSPAPQIEMNTWCSFTNPQVEAIHAEISLLGIPAGCRPLEARKVFDLGPRKSSRAVLSLSCDPSWLPAARDTQLTLEIAVPDQPPIRHSAPVSLIVAQPITQSINIDGDLSDWPAVAGNVASEFRLIAGPCHDAVDPCDQPSLRAFAFVVRDAENLYIALNMESRPQAGSVVRRRSIVYDDLIPMDEEDLAEILIDPLNAGTRTPSDLYHIAVKRSGVYLFEKGISTWPPLGPRKTWQADIDVASREQPTRWTAELRIPIASIAGSATRRGEVWGFNVTHYNAADQEFSTWSGAVGNAYDPLSLGNLLLP